MSFGLEWTNQSLKDLDNLEIFVKKRIIKKILDFIEAESFHGIKRMIGYDNMYRLRFGDYRVIFEIIDGIVFITKVGHRGNIY